MNIPVTVPTPRPYALMSPQASAALIGGARQNNIESDFNAMSASLAPSRLQLATAITQRHYTYNDAQDLNNPIGQSLAQDWQKAHMTFVLNDQDGPWAVAMSNSALAWAAVAAADLSPLQYVGDFLAFIYRHLR